MATYWLHYEWTVKGARRAHGIGDNAILFEASSDEEARKKVKQFMQDFRDNAPEGITYELLRIVKEI